jgi:hypothetical protein
MNDLATLVTICKKALSSRNKIVRTLRKKRLTEEEKELLAAASGDLGRFQVCSHIAIPGGWIKAGKRDFFDKADYAYHTRYMKAFQTLCERGYIEYRTGKLFVLNSFGYDRATGLDRG